MGLKKGLFTCTRFTVAAPPPGDFSGRFDAGIKALAFRDFFPENEEKYLGWTGLQEILDRDFAYAGHSLGDYRVFSLRRDQKSVPAALLRLRVLEAQQRLLRERETKKLYKEEREALRESVRKELLKQAPPVPALFDVCWSLSRNRVYFSSLGEKILQDFQDLFRESFALDATIHVPWPELLLSPTSEAGASERETSAGAVPAVQHPGREFLTWLWFKSEERNGRIALSGSEEIGLSFVRRLVLTAGSGDYTESVVCQGQHASLLEGKEALRRGKLVREARLTLQIDAQEWEFTIKADHFQVQSLKLPVPAEEDGEKSGEEEEGMLLERIFLIEKVFEIMDRLYDLFSALRTSAAWHGETARLSAWLNR